MCFTAVSAVGSFLRRVSIRLRKLPPNVFPCRKRSPSLSRVHWYELPMRVSCLPSKDFVATHVVIEALLRVTVILIYLKPYKIDMFLLLRYSSFAAWTSLVFAFFHCLKLSFLSWLHLSRSYFLPLIQDSLSFLLSSLRLSGSCSLPPWKALFPFFIALVSF